MSRKATYLLRRMDITMKATIPVRKAGAHGVEQEDYNTTPGRLGLSRKVAIPVRMVRLTMKGYNTMSVRLRWSRKATILFRQAGVDHESYNTCQEGWG